MGTATALLVINQVYGCDSGTGGGGGGRPDFAQAGGKDASKIGEAIEKFHSLVGAA